MIADGTRDWADSIARTQKRLLPVSPVPTRFMHQALEAGALVDRRHVGTLYFACGGARVAGSVCKVVVALR